MSDQVDLNKEVELITAAVEISPLIKQFREEGWAEMCATVEGMTGGQARGMLQLSIGLLAVTMHGTN